MSDVQWNEVKIIFVGDTSYKTWNRSMWRDEALLLDMLLAARRIRKYTQGVNAERFYHHEIMQDAVMRQIQIIGEAARKVSLEFQVAHPEIPWSKIIGMRNRLVHEYFRIIPEKVWQVVESDIPKLSDVLEPLVPPE